MYKQESEFNSNFKFTNVKSCSQFHKQDSVSSLDRLNNPVILMSLSAKISSHYFWNEMISTKTT